MPKRDVVVKSGETLVVTNTDREFGTVQIQPGGQISVKTSADVKIDKLIKSQDTKSKD